MRKEKNWKTIVASPTLSTQLQEQLKVNPVICNMLVSRGIDDYNKAKDFFRPSIAMLHPPLLMKDMEKAVARILFAIEKNEKILIYGDYDVDGTTSVAIVYDFLSKIYTGENISFYIPNRYKEGYGLSQAGIEHAIESGISLLITLDCGIKSVDLIAIAKEKGIDSIICDHHLPGDAIPDAYAILNAKQKDCPYPYKELCGCGVGYKLITALADELNLDACLYEPYLELVATAIAADIVPITGENRVMTFFGLKQTNSAPSTGIKALIQLSKITGKINITSLGFLIGPRINAAGRMDDAKKAVSLFIEKDFDKALHIASLLQTDNNSRKEADAMITEEAISMLENNMHEKSKKSIVLFSPEWHKGVIGIVASRLLERFYKPTIVFTKSGDVIAGSARSIAGFNIHDGLEKCDDLLIGYGGHYFAAGMTLLPENLDEFKNRFELAVSSTLTEDDFIPVIHIDAEVNLSDLTSSFLKILEQMEPFGPENPKPLFMVKGLKNTGCKIVKENHVRFVVEQKGKRFSGIGFNLAEKYKTISENSALDLVFHLEENTYMDQTSLQLKVIDLKASK